MSKVAVPQTFRDRQATGPRVTDDGTDGLQPQRLLQPSATVSAC